ncbi:hypothetical protein ATCC90586_007077 [Pythium insidiosum]|nr:hypothetical protein ATCC90586_007077 [Pythium insidiosum]
MPQSVTEPDVDYESQLYEIRRLISTTTDPDRRLVLEDQLRELELARLQQDRDDTQLPSARQERRKSFRPNSAKPRSTLTPLTEDKEVHLSTPSFDELDGYRTAAQAPTLVLDVFATSFDDRFPVSNVLSNDPRTFWMTCGLYPQLLRLTLREPTLISDVEVTFRHVRSMEIRCSPRRASSMAKVTMARCQFPATESGKLITHKFDMGRDERVEVVEIGVESGYSEFAIIYVVRLNQPDSSDSKVEEAR